MIIVVLGSVVYRQWTAVVGAAAIVLVVVLLSRTMISWQLI